MLPGYLEAMGVRPLAGRLLEDADRATGEAAVVNTTASQHTSVATRSATRCAWAASSTSPAYRRRRAQHPARWSPWACGTGDVHPARSERRGHIVPALAHGHAPARRNVPVDRSAEAGGGVNGSPRPRGPGQAGNGGAQQAGREAEAPDAAAHDARGPRTAAHARRDLQHDGVCGRSSHARDRRAGRLRRTSCARSWA